MRRNTKIVPSRLPTFSFGTLAPLGILALAGLTVVACASGSGQGNPREVLPLSDLHVNFTGALEGDGELVDIECTLVRASRVLFTNLHITISSKPYRLVISGRAGKHILGPEASLEPFVQLDDLSVPEGERVWTSGKVTGPVAGEVIIESNGDGSLEADVEWPGNGRVHIKGRWTCPPVVPPDNRA